VERGDNGLDLRYGTEGRDIGDGARMEIASSATDHDGCDNNITSCIGLRLAILPGKYSSPFAVLILRVI